MHPVKQQDTNDDQQNMQKLFHEIKYMKQFFVKCAKRGIPFDGNYYAIKLNNDQHNSENGYMDKICSEMKCLKEIFAQCAKEGIPFEENYYTKKYFETMSKKKGNIKKGRVKKEKDQKWKPSKHGKKIATKEYSTRARHNLVCS